MDYGGDPEKERALASSIHHPLLRERGVMVAHIAWDDGEQFDSDVFDLR